MCYLKRKKISLINRIKKKTAADPQMIYMVE